MSSEAEAEINPEETGADENAAVNDNPPKNPREAELEGLYKRLPKVISRISESNIAEAGAALQSLMASFRKINEIEQELLEPGETHVPLSLSRIYELAVGGGANPDAAKELEEANATFAEQNTILAELVESLNFHLEDLKRKSADEILARGDAKIVPLADLKAAVGQVSETMAKIEAQLSVLRAPTDQGQLSQKPLDERIAEGIIGFDDITSELLKAAPTRTTFIGRMLRRAGFAYDHKDIASTRQLVVAVLRANRTMAEINASLVPAREQLDKLHRILTLVELFAGHEERQGVQYQEALQEIDRANAKYERLVQKSADLETIEQELADKNTEIEGKQEELRDLASKKQEIAGEVIELRQTNKEQLTELEGLKKKLETLNQKHRELKQVSFYEIRALKDRIRQSENGLLLEKLESEIEGLREMAKDSEEKCEKEREIRKAFESRVQIWIENEESLQKKIKKLSDNINLRKSFIVAACGVGAVLGYGAGAVLATKSSSALSAYFLWVTAVPAAAGTFFTLLAKENLKKALVGGLAAGVFGAAVGSIGALNANSQVRNEVSAAKVQLEQSHVEFLTKECKDSPCRIKEGKDGKYYVEVMSKEFKGLTVTFDFTSNNVVMSRTEQMVKPPESKKTEPK